MNERATPAPGGGISTSQSPPFAVPLRYMLLGVLCFGLFAVDFAIQSTALTKGAPGAPNVVALTHALTLGALLSFVMGAVYQLTTVAFLIPIASVRVARFNFWLYLVGFVGLFISMSLWSPAGLLAFGSCTIAAIYLYAVMLIVSLTKTKVKGAMYGFVLSAHAYLILAVTAALFLVLSDSGIMPGLEAWMGPLLATHILLAAGGYFTFLVMGFSLKLLPMFTLSHGFSTRRQVWTLVFAHAALWFIVIGVWTVTALVWAGVVVGVAAFVSQVLDIRGIVKRRMRKRIEAPIRSVIAAVVAGALGLGLVAARVLWTQGAAGWQGVVGFYLLGVVTLTVMSFAYKIVPFLVWTKRYSKVSQTGRPVLIGDLIHVNSAWPVLIAFAVGVVALTISTAVNWSAGVIGSCILTSLAILLFTVQVVRVLEPKRWGKELFEHD